MGEISVFVNAKKGFFAKLHRRSHLFSYTYLIWYSNRVNLENLNNQNLILRLISGVKIDAYKEKFR